MINERLFYISSVQKLPAVPKQLQKFIPLYDVIKGIQERGVVGYASESEIPPEQITAFIRKGKASGEQTSIEEYKSIIAKLCYEGIEQSNITAKEKVKFYALLFNWMNEKISLVDKSVSTFDVAYTAEQDFIFQTGFEPLDVLTGGIPHNSFTLFLAATKAGKTSVMLALANKLAIRYRIVYASIEMSANAVRYRAQHCANLSAKDVLLTGNVAVSDLEEFADKNTIIIVDYLALVTSTVTSELRHKYVDIAQGLLRLSTQCKAVISAHQARRSEKELTVDSLSESYAVAFYPSLIVGITKGGNDFENPGYTNVNLTIVANRYGKANNLVIFPFNYATLDYRSPTVSGEAGIDYDTNW